MQICALSLEQIVRSITDRLQFQMPDGLSEQVLTAFRELIAQQHRIAGDQQERAWRGDEGGPNSDMLWWLGAALHEIMEGGKIDSASSFIAKYKDAAPAGTSDDHICLGLALAIATARDMLAQALLTTG